MNKHYYIFIFLIFLTTVGQAQVVGHIRDKTTGKPLKGTRVTLWVYSYDTLSIYPSIFPLETNTIKTEIRDTVYKRVHRTYTDSAGYYFLQAICPDIYKISAFHPTSKEGEHLHGEFEESETFSLESDGALIKDFQLAVFCPYDYTKAQTNCPKCNKEDQVWKIIYGLVTVPFNPQPGYYYTGYCDVPRCHPTQRCMRCDHEF